MLKLYDKTGYDYEIELPVAPVCTPGHVVGNLTPILWFSANKTGKKIMKSAQQNTLCEKCVISVTMLKVI